MLDLSGNLTVFGGTTKCRSGRYYWALFSSLSDSISCSSQHTTASNMPSGHIISYFLSGGFSTGGPHCPVIFPLPESQALPVATEILPGPFLTRMDVEPVRRE